MLLGIHTPTLGMKTWWMSKEFCFSGYTYMLNKSKLYMLMLLSQGFDVYRIPTILTELHMHSTTAIYVSVTWRRCLKTTRPRKRVQKAHLLKKRTWKQGVKTKMHDGKWKSNCKLNEFKSIQLTEIKNYFASSDPHHDMLGGGCQVRVVIENIMGRMENLRTLISGFLGLVILVRWALVTMFLSWTTQTGCRIHRTYVSLIGSGEGRHTTHLLKCVPLLSTSQTDWKQSSDVLSDISFDILSDISSDIFFWYIFWHSFWHIFWYILLIYLLTFFLTYLLTFFLTSFWHIFWHSFWQIFWHSFWHIFWHIFRHAFWHIFWHSFWHIKTKT